MAGNPFQPGPGQTMGNNQPVGSAGQPFPPGKSKSGKKGNSEAKSAAIARRMEKSKSKKKQPAGKGGH